MPASPSYHETSLSFDELTERHKGTTPHGPQFKKINEYLNDDAVLNIAELIVKSIESSIRKFGYALKESRKDRLKQLIYSSLTEWGSNANYNFKPVPSKEFIYRPLRLSFADRFRKKRLIVEDFSSKFGEVLKRIDMPQVKAWIDNEYKANERHTAYREDADRDIMFLNVRRKHNNTASRSSPGNN